MNRLESHLELARIARKGQIFNPVGLVGQFPVDFHAGSREHLDEVGRLPKVHQQAIHQAQQGDHTEGGPDFTCQLAPPIYLP